MSTTLEAAMIALGYQLGDIWESTTTSGGTTTHTTLIDTALKAKQNNWITYEAYDRISSGTMDGQERKVSSLDNTTGTITFTVAHSTTVATSIDYEVHRMFTASDKRRALLAACRDIFPYCHERILDESFVSKNWLKDGSLEVWTSATALTYWTTSVSTLAQTSTAALFKHGNYSCKLSTATGYIEQSITNHDDLKRLAGKTVTFSAQGHSDTASCLRLGIVYDGTNIEYSDYHDGDSTWTKNDEPLKVQYTIDEHPTQIKFRVYHAVAAANSYVDDLRVIAGSNDSPRIFIGNLNLANNYPAEVFVEPYKYCLEEPWVLISNVDFDYENGYMYLPSSVVGDLRLRVKGLAYLDFLASGVASTAWTATINLGQPYLDILVAEAAVYLYKQLLMPNLTTGSREEFADGLSYWQAESKRRKNKYGMPIPNVVVSRRN